MDKPFVISVGPDGSYAKRATVRPYLFAVWVKGIYGRVNVVGTDGRWHVRHWCGSLALAEQAESRISSHYPDHCIRTVEAGPGKTWAADAS